MHILLEIFILFHFNTYIFKWIIFTEEFYKLATDVDGLI